MTSRAWGWLPGAAIVSVVASLVGRVIVRGAYYPGFDVHGAANGLYLLSTERAWDAVATVLARSRDYSAPFPYYSLLYALLPGLLTALRPWEWWAHVLTFVTAGVTVALLGRALGLARRDVWVLLLAWGASPALLSLSVGGMAWVSACLPHALALLIVLDPRLRRRWLLNVVLCAVTTELTWHVYELGKTVDSVFVVGALLGDGVPLALRALWLAVGGWQTAAVFLHPTQHVTAYSGILGISPGVVAGRVTEIAKLLFVTPWLDLPVLAVAAALACARPSRTRLILALLLVAQVGLVVAMSLREYGMDEVRPRRFVMVDFYCLALAASLWGDVEGGRLRRAVALLLVAGNVWALGDLVRFAARPFEPYRIGTVFTLPFTTSQLDYMVAPDQVDWVREMAAQIDAGRTVLLVYGFDAYGENFSNPDGILERLYVRLGDARYRQSVVVFGSIQCHHDCVPVRPMAELEPYLDALRAAGPARWATVAGYDIHAHEYDTAVFRADHAAVMAALRARFALRGETPEGAKFDRFWLAALPADAPSS